MHLNVVLLVTTVYYGDIENANAFAAANHGQWNGAALYIKFQWAGELEHGLPAT